MTIELTPAQIKAFKEALLAAFDRSDLEQVCFYGLGVRWQKVVREGTLDAQTNDLVLYADQNSQVPELLAAARQRNPRNARLIKFEQELLAGAPSTLTAAPPPPPEYQPLIELSHTEHDGIASLEALLFAQHDARLPFAFLEGAMRTARSTARIAVPRYHNGKPDGGRMFGTGWLIAPGLLITNHHVVDARDLRPKPLGWGEQHAGADDFRLQAEHAVASFDYFAGDEPDANGPELRDGRLVAADAALDYALIEYADTAAVGDRPALKIVQKQPALTRGARLNIVQHPQGRYIRFAIRNNFFVGAANGGVRLRYQTDTEPGASGSPVCNDQWRVAGLHHASVQVENQVVPQEVLQGQPAPVTLLNEAITLAAILDSLDADLRATITTAQAKLP